MIDSPITQLKGKGDSDVLLTDIYEVKSLLGISLSDPCQDRLLGFLIEMASDWIEEWLGRRLEYKQRTEYYNGTGTMQLPLRARPVYPSGMTVWHDLSGYFGQEENAFSSDPLVYGKDYGLEIDQDDGTSRSGLLLRFNRVWTKGRYASPGLLTPWMGTSFGSIKVQYNAGYTVDNLPSPIRLAATTLVANIKYMLPLGLDLNSDSYEAKSIGINVDKKNQLLKQTVKNMLISYRNTTWGTQ